MRRKYLITGGLGGIGLVLAKHLSEKWHSQLVLTTRHALIPETRAKVASLKKQQISFEVAEADASNQDQMKALFKTHKDKGNPIEGVFHVAGNPGGGFLYLRDRAQSRVVLTPKVDGMVTFRKVLVNYPVEFFVAFSSLSAIQGELGQGDYCSANCYLDAATRLLEKELGIPCLAINWARWESTGMAKELHHDPRQWIKPQEGMELLERLMVRDIQQVVATPYPLHLV